MECLPKTDNFVQWVQISLLKFPDQRSDGISFTELMVCTSVYCVVIQYVKRCTWKSWCGKIFAHQGKIMNVELLYLNPCGHHCLPQQKSVALSNKLSVPWWKQALLRSVSSVPSVSFRSLFSLLLLQLWELQGSIILTVSSCLAHSEFENLVV